MTPSTSFAARPITLSFAPRDFQSACVADVLDRLANTPDPAFLYASPTGTGKSVIELMLLAALPDALLITPRLEIVAGMLQKQGVDCGDWSDQRLARDALHYRITTPVRLRNMLAKGTLPFRPAQVIIDEAHHDLADTYQDIAAFLPSARRVGLTATPYRGTPRGTADYLARWGDCVTWVLTLPQAAQRGYIAVPAVELWPLVDDDELQVQNGEVVAAISGNALTPRLAEVVQRCRGMVDERTIGRILPNKDDDPLRDCFWDRPTLFAVPTTDNVWDLVGRLNDAGLPAVGVTQDSSRAERNQAFADCVARRKALVQIDVVSEGVDLPIRRCLDLRPTLSPVRWLQQLGRILRPVKSADEPGSVYVCCNRNLERHGYLMEGLIPPAYLAQAQKQFPKPSQRAQSRAVGLEGVGRFKPTDIELTDGCVGQLYTLYSLNEFARVDWAVLVHPAVAAPLVATRTSARDANGYAAWGKWRRVDALPVDLRGFQSSTAGELTDKQKNWWTRAAVRHGLDPGAKVSRRAFVALPVLSDTRTCFQVGGW